MEMYIIYDNQNRDYKCVEAEEAQHLIKSNPARFTVVEIGFEEDFEEGHGWENSPEWKMYFDFLRIEIEG